MTSMSMTFESMGVGVGSSRINLDMEKRDLQFEI